jgi:hypothetical protein
MLLLCNIKVYFPHFPHADTLHSLLQVDWGLQRLKRLPCLACYRKWTLGWNSGGFNLKTHVSRYYTTSLLSDQDQQSADPQEAVRSRRENFLQIFHVFRHHLCHLFRVIHLWFCWYNPWRSARLSLEMPYFFFIRSTWWNLVKPDSISL